MKKFTLTAVLSILFLGTGLVNAQSIAHVNSLEILESMPEYKAAQADLEKQTKRHQAEIQRQENEIKALLEKGQKQIDAVKNKSEAEQRKVMQALQPLQEELQQKQQALAQYQQTATQELSKKQADVTRPIFEKVQLAIDSVGKKKEIGYIFDLAAAEQSGTLVYYGGGVEVTDDVKKELGLK